MLSVQRSREENHASNRRSKPEVKDMTDQDTHKKEIAGAITRGIYKNLPWETDVSNTLDESMERVKMAHFLNDAVADWIREKHPGYFWSPVHHDELKVIHTVGNFAWMCFGHIFGAKDAPIHLPFDQTFALPKGDNDVA